MVVTAALTDDEDAGYLVDGDPSPTVWIDEWLGLAAIAVPAGRDPAFRLGDATALEPNDPYNVYGVACFYSAWGRKEDGLHYFETALRRGFAHREWIANDTDLDNIRGEPAFAELVEQYLGQNS